MTQPDTLAPNTPTRTRSFTVDTRRLNAALAAAYRVSVSPGDRNYADPMPSLQVVYLIPEGGRIVVGATDRYMFSVEDLPVIHGTPFPVAMSREDVGMFARIAALNLNTSAVFTELGNGEVQVRTTAAGEPRYSSFAPAEDDFEIVADRLLQFREEISDPDAFMTGTDADNARYQARLLTAALDAVRLRNEALGLNLSIQLPGPSGAGRPFRIQVGSTFFIVVLGMSGPSYEDEREAKEG